MRRGRAPEIVKAEIDARGRLDPNGRLLKIRERKAALAAREYVARGVAGRLEPAKDCDALGPERYAMRQAVFGPGGCNGSSAVFKVKLIPAHAADLTLALRREQRQPENRGDLE